MSDWFSRFLALLFLLAALLPMLLIALLLFCTSGRVFYRETRLGLHRKPFEILKFRTMNPAVRLSPEEKSELQASGKLRKDPRVTRIGRLLRRFSLDELPQLWNAVCGDMALVGPRPIVESEEHFYGAWCETLHSVKPGLTGLWQVSGRSLMPYRQRVALNLYYIRHKSWTFDLWILYRTVFAVLGGRGAF